MARIIFSKDTKLKLQQVARSGQVVESWMPQFIRCDNELQAELFRIAENAKNWSFLESFVVFRANQKPQATRTKQIRRPVPPTSNHIPRVSRKTIEKYSSKQEVKPEFKTARIQYAEHDFTHCPNCKVRLLKTVLPDHLDLACRERGKNTGIIFDDPVQKQGDNLVLTRCEATGCRANAIPGDAFCYDHKVA